MHKFNVMYYRQGYDYKHQSEKTLSVFLISGLAVDNEGRLRKTYYFKFSIANIQCLSSYFQAMRI